MEAREREGGPSYSSGAFNEEALRGPKPAKRQKNRIVDYCTSKNGCLTDFMVTFV